MPQQYQRDAGNLSGGMVLGFLAGISLFAAIILIMWLLFPDNWLFDVTNRFFKLDEA